MGLCDRVLRPACPGHGMEVNWIICPHRAGLDNIRRAINTFLSQDLPDVRVLCLDRESTDGFSQWVRAKYPNGEVTVLWDPNDSVAGAWNRALRLVLDRFKSQYALVCNDDVELRPDTYRLLLADGSGFVTAVGVKDRRQMESADPSLRNPHPDFSCFLIRDWVWRRVGPFDEGYLRGYGEDCHAHCTMYSLGIEAVSIAVPFLHHACGTLNYVSEAEAEAIRLQADRNRELFHRQWGFKIGSPEYDAFFSPENFGVQTHVAGVAKPL
jgi:glycosyltransferase involved in cell wall biosynthesis